MKKILIILLFTILFFSSINIKANSNEYVTREYYFENLKENFGQNIGYSCRFVALEMLLMYYDTFLNDDIVPEKYEVKTNNRNISPGSLNDSSLYNHNENYIEHIIEYKDKSLHAKLLNYRVEDLLDTTSGTLNAASLTVDNDEYINIIKRYLSEFCGLVENVDYNITFTDTNVRNFIIDKLINSNEVVIANLEQVESLNGHSVIAYEYTNDTIYMNYGYHSGNVNTSHEDLSIENSNQEIVEHILCSAFSIEFNIEHKHSDNYSIKKDYKSHINYCPCGYINDENHQFKVNGQNGICIDCYNNESMSNNVNIISDPDLGTNCGTYVSLYGANYRENDLIPGFTRLLYLDYNSPSVSRLDYDWYSEDEDIAIVTRYGTVMGVTAGTTKIYAYLKSDPRIYGVFNLTVLNVSINEYYYIEMTTDIRPLNEFNGTEVTILNNNPGLFTIHSGYSRALCFKNSNAYPSINNFIWLSNSNAISIDEYGVVFANEVDEITIVTITGIHKNNPKIKAVVQFTILPN